jgi:ABC-type bacteriocin/lantibiotic exporter with double-glycine peptidase domain
MALNQLRQRLPQLLQRISLGRRSRIPFRAQTTHAECGAASLAMVLSYYGRDVPIEDIRHVVGVDRNGANAHSVLQAARWYGLNGRGFKASLDDLKAHVRIGSILYWDFHHFVVFEAATRTHLHIVDPALGPRKLSWEEASKHFTGIILTLEPGDRFQPENRRNFSGRRYWQALAQERETLTRILVVSLLLQLLALMLPFATSVMVDRVIGRADHDLWLLLAISLGLLLAYKALASFLRAHLFLRLRAVVDARLTIDFVIWLAGLPLSFFERRGVGDLLIRMGAQARIREMLTSTALSAVLDGLLVILYLVALLLISPALALAATLLAGLRVIAFMVFYRRQVELSAEMVTTEARSRGLQVHLLSGMETLKSAGIEANAVEQWSHAYTDEVNAAVRQARLQAVSDLVQNTLADASPLIMLMLGGLLVLSGELTLGLMLGGAALAGAFFVPFSSLIQVAGEFSRIKVELERANEVYNQEPEQSTDSARWVADSLSGRIDLKEVSFRYGPHSPEVVKQVSLSIKPGQMVALVGRSGCGKSTLARLLLGLYPPSSGSVSFDGIDVAQQDLTALRQQLGVVTQQPYLFNASIKDNIAAFDPQMRFAQVVEAARLAQIHDDIMALPMGYHTMLSDRGDTLSGGQRQRLALARALARRPRILLLDEATSALDTVNEGAIHQALSELRMTRIVIAHRLSTIVNADRIVVVEQGSILARGRHDKLLSSCQHYAQLVAAQRAGQV